MLGHVRKGARLLPRLAPAAARITTTTAEQQATAPEAETAKKATSTPLMREFAIYRRARASAQTPSKSTRRAP
jgi:hypothetical protein